MQSHGLTVSLFRVCEWITKLAYINLLWFFFTLIGFFLVGFAPATVSMFSVIRKWRMGEEEFSIFQAFWTNYKREFIKSNLMWFSVVLILIIGYVDWVIIQSMSGMLYYFFFTSFIIMAFFSTIVLLYIFPVYVHFEGSLLHYYKSAILLGLSFPLRTLCMVMATLIVVLVSVTFPAIGVLFFGSGLSFILMYISYSVFNYKQSFVNESS